MSDQHGSMRGIWAINLSMLAFVAGDVVLKILGQDIPSSELVFFRSVIIAAGLSVIMLVKRHRLHLERLSSFPLLARAVLDAANIVAFTTAIVHMRMGELYAITSLAPLLMTAMAAIFYKEPVGIRRWLAIMVGFVGVLLVVKPDIDTFDHWALLGLLVAFTAALREMATQKIDHSTPTIEVTFYSVLAVGIATFVIGCFEPWVTPNRQQALFIFTFAVTWLAGTSLLIQACRLVHLSIIACFRYTLLVWGGLAGYFIFGDRPDYLSYVGAALIAGSGLYVFHREAVRQRTLASTSIPLGS